jgi:hypothetical protein
MSDLEKRTSATEKSVPASSSEDGVVVGNVGAVGEYTNETAKGVEPTGHLHRKFKARHVQMIALAGNIGSGVFISIGAVSDDGRQWENISNGCVGSKNWRWTWYHHWIYSHLLHGIGYVDCPWRGNCSVSNLWLFYRSCNKIC